MILSSESIRQVIKIDPFSERMIAFGMSYGLGPASYDFRIKEHVILFPGEFQLASLIEWMKLPNNIGGVVLDKSTFARKGLSLFNTWIDPGWEGYLTIEMKNNGLELLEILPGSPICQVVFQWIDKDCQGYDGKYQNQPSTPIKAIFEK